MITLDTSAIYALLDRRNPLHAMARRALDDERAPFIVPLGILAEIAYLVEDRLPPVAMDAFLEDLEAGRYTLDRGDGDIARIRTLVGRYADLPLGTADAIVIACAERNGRRVITFDRDFSIVAREGTIHPVP